MLRKIHPGQPAGALLQSRAWNQLVDAARRGPPRPPPVASDGGGEYLAVPVRNDSGADVERFGILGLGEPLFTPALNLDEFKNGVSFSGLLPDIDLHVGKFVVCLDPIAEDQIGTGLLLGVTAVQLDVQDEDDTHADIADGDATQLETGLAGAAQILWKPTGTGTVWGFVRLGRSGDMNFVIGKLDGGLTYGGSATVSVWTGAGGAESDSTRNITAYDWLLRSGDDPLIGGTQVMCQRANAASPWYVTAAQCPE